MRKADQQNLVLRIWYHATDRPATLEGWVERGGRGAGQLILFCMIVFRVKTLSDICFRPGDSNKELTRNYKKPKNTTLILGPSGIGRKGVCFCRLSSIRKLTSAVSFIILIPRDLNLGRRASPIMLSFYLGEKMTLPL